MAPARLTGPPGRALKKTGHFVPQERSCAGRGYRSPPHDQGSAGDGGGDALPGAETRISGGAEATLDWSDRDLARRLALILSRADPANQASSALRIPPTPRPGQGALGAHPVGGWA